MIDVPPRLEAYYAPVCAPCRLELPAVLKALDTGNDIRILIVSDIARAKSDLQAVSPHLDQAAHIAAGRDARDRLRRAGDADGILPFARSVSARGKVCATWRGALTAFRIQDLLSRCR